MVFSEKNKNLTFFSNKKQKQMGWKTHVFLNPVWNSLVSFHNILYSILSYLIV